MSRVVGRQGLLTEIAGLLGAGTSVALCGPAGVGKSALLDVLEEQARARDVTVLRCAGAPEEAALPYSAVRDLLAPCPLHVLDDVPEPVRGWIRAGLVGVEVSDEARSHLAAAFHGVLAAWSAQRPLLMLLDDVQWLDAESSAVVGYARRRLDTVALVATLGPGENEAIDVSGLHHLDVPPLDAVDMVELLCRHGLGPDVAQRVHVEAGGMPALALALAGAIGERPALLGAPSPMPPSVQRVLRERFLAQSAQVRETLVTASLLPRPTARDLERSGRADAHDDVRRAVLSGALTWGEAGLRFTPSGLRDVIVESLPAGERAARHRTLADLAASPAERLRHLALADARPDAALAADLAAAAREAAGGRRDLAAELYLLAADRATLDLADHRVEWLVRAVETAAPGNHAEVVRRALAATRDLDLTPAQAVRVRLAIPELAGAEVSFVDEVLTAALSDAGDDDALVAKVLLQRARIALMEARPHAAHVACERAVRILEESGGDDDLALGLTTLAVARRWVGGDHQGPLQRAVELTGPAPVGFVHISPEYMQARFAFYDDQLDEAWAAFLGMLAQVERGGGMDHVHVLRCLVEVAARTGRCREAMEYADRAARIGEEFDLDGHTSWFITAQAELVGGSLERARLLAQRGVEAAGDCGDVRYLTRHLIVLGQALVRSGDAEGAIRALDRVRRLEEEGRYSDPTVSRWHADAVTALAALARLGEATELLAAAREQVARRSATTGTDGVTALLDRAEAELLLAGGDLEGASHLLDRAAKVAHDVGMPVEVGRTLVVRAHLERRRRRAAAARAALGGAHALFTDLRAMPWVAQVEAELTPAPSRSGAGDPLLDRLTEAEARIAHAVAGGASNREIAERSYVSVKTVEATLTRIYRKLDVRSRTQLAALLVPAPPE